MNIVAPFSTPAAEYTPLIAFTLAYPSIETVNVNLSHPGSIVDRVVYAVVVVVSAIVVSAIVVVSSSLSIVCLKRTVFESSLFVGQHSPRANMQLPRPFEIRVQRA